MKPKLVFFCVLIIPAFGVLAQTAPTSQRASIIQTLHTAADGDQVGLGRALLSPDASKLAVQLIELQKRQSVITIYDVATTQALFECRGPADGTFWLAAFATDSSKAAFIRPNDGSSSTLEVVDIGAARIIYSCVIGPGICHGETLFTSEGRQIIYREKRSGRDPDHQKVVYAVADLAANKVVSELKLDEYDGPRELSADDSLLLTYRLQVWDMKTATRVCTFQQDRDYSPLATRFLGDAKSVRGLDRDLTVRTWDTRSGKLISRIGPQVQFQGALWGDFDREGSLFYARAGAVLICDARTGKPLGMWQPGVWLDEVNAMSGTALVRNRGNRSRDLMVMRLPPLSELAPVRNAGETRRK